MKCGDIGYIQAFLDGELSRDERKQFSIHLENCNTCRALLQESKQLDSWITQAMQETLSTNIEPPLDVDTAWNQLQERLQRERVHSNKEVSDQDQNKTKKRGWKHMKHPAKKWIGVAAAVVIAIGAFSNTKVQAMAENFLSVFRVDKVEMVKLTESDINEMESWLNGNGEAGMKELKGIGKVWIDDESKERSPQFFESVAAAKEAGFVPASAPAGYEADSMMVSPNWTLRMQLDTEKANRMLKQMQSDVQFDNGLNGKQFSFSLPQISVTNFEAKNPDASQIAHFSYFESDAPFVNVPDGVNMDQLRATVLQLPFIPTNVRSQLASIEDWQNTLPVPYVEGKTDVRQVTVKGSQGVLIEGEHMGILMWQKSGKLYRIETHGGDSQAFNRGDALLELANQMN